MATSYSAIAKVTGQSIAEKVMTDLEALQPEPVGVGVFEVEDGSGLWEVAAYFSQAPDVAALGILEALNNISPFIVSEIPEQDWVAKVRRDLPPVEAGRFFVHGSHDVDKVPAGSVPLLIEAAMAFGTGHHGTTLGCLRALDDLLTSGVEFKSVVDVGCGTAVLAMAAAKVTDACVYASDIDPVAIEVSEANLKSNALDGRVTCLVAAGLDDSTLEDAAPYDLIFANILKGPLIAIAPDMAKACGPDSFVILSGILNEQAEDVTTHYSKFGFKLHSKHQIVDWTTLILRRNQ